MDFFLTKKKDLVMKATLNLHSHLYIQIYLYKCVHKRKLIDMLALLADRKLKNELCNKLKIISD